MEKNSIICYTYKKGGDTMASNEKELNVFLLAHLDSIEDALLIAEKEHAEETIEFLKRRKAQVERMLYQKPPISGE